MDAAQFEATLAKAELRLRRLRTLYDQYFMGIERTEPHTERTEVERAIDLMRRSQPRNTALRFRFNQLVQRLTTYNAYWQRVRRQIEEGTYKRDVLRARRRFGDLSRQPKGGLELDIDIEAAMESMPASAPPPEPAAPVPSPDPAPVEAPRPLATAAGVKRPAPASAPMAKPKVAQPSPPPPQAAGSGGGMSEAQIQALYQRYVDARRQNQERTDNVKLETIAKTVRDMLPKLAEKHAGKRIDFDIVLKGGRVALKPVPK